MMNIVGHNPATAGSPRGDNPFTRFNTTAGAGFGMNPLSPDLKNTKAQGFLYQVDQAVKNG